MAFRRLLEHALYPHTSLNFDKLALALKGKTILLTGATSGIGEQLARQLAEVPVRLLLTGRREEKLYALQQELAAKPASVEVLAADLRQENDRKRLIELMQREPRGIDLLLSNAGHSIRRPILESLGRLHDFERTMAIHYTAPVALILAALPYLQANGGHIVNVSTINVLLPPFPHWAAYQASKAAMDTWLRSAAPEFKAAGVRTSTIYLPLVRTPMIEPTAAYRNAPTMAADQAARRILRMLYTHRKRVHPWWFRIVCPMAWLFHPAWARSAVRKQKRFGEERS
ncbi:SDR family NAD(P)-dependent oxidoreductase [Gorillibacterium sp. CAU 1737]|uniref:SDR family NAD(P)-dependent oxidoreductase n=1 Tax=Gorillibacterium sp. CAU 1737 TaxID=3140362 RepID=UPI0032605A10